MLKHSTFFAVTATCLSFCSLASAADREFSGSWEYVERVDGLSRPRSIFEITLNETDDGAVIGSYCSITQSGNRVDCDTDGIKNIAGHVEKASRHAKVRFFSFFGAKDGIASISSNDDSLTWEVKSKPVGDFFYGPYAVTLMKKPSGTHEGEHQVVIDKAYLYPAPSQTAVTKTYVVKGDYVKILAISDDLNFWKVSFSRTSGRKILRWIDCRAINFCP